MVGGERFAKFLPRRRSTVARASEEQLVITDANMNMSLDDLMKKKTSRFSASSGPTKTIGKKPRGNAAPYQTKQQRFVQQSRPPTAAPGGGTAAVHVANLSYSTTWRGLKDYLSTAAAVSRVDIATRDDGTSRGFATAVFENMRGARTAIATLHETELDGRVLRLEQKAGDYDPTAFGGGRQVGSRGSNSKAMIGVIPDEPGDGYTYSGGKGRNGWVKPDAKNFVDKGPPPEPRMVGASSLSR